MKEQVLLFLKKLWVKTILVLFFVPILFYLMFVNYTDPTELGIVRNRVTGQMWAQDIGGWKLTAPWVSVAVMDLRPIRVAVPSAGHGYSSKLVQFDPKYWKEFVAIEGFRYYWWSNRISFNFGYNDEYRGVRDIMRGYAYSPNKYSFIKTITEYK